MKREETKFNKYTKFIFFQKKKGQDQLQSENVTMSGACVAGRASVCGRWDIKDVRAAGVWYERRRFVHTRHDLHDVNPRARSLGLMEETLLNTRAAVP